jgi:DNA mismatch repair protein MutL
MQKKIQLLPSDLINKIAAGEVVERPASILKELLENSIDAGAKDIVVELENSGIDSISVSDNGSGMSKENAKMALLQHATSKISKIEDLDNIHTLGFRGEALASIASISELVIHTFDGETIPLTISSKDGITTLKDGPARNRGTTIRSSRIFANIPARRKFLKSEATEYRYIFETFLNIVLESFGIRFKLIKNGKLALDLLTAENRLQRITQVFSYIKVSDLTTINYQDSQHKIEGYLLKPGANIGSTPKQYFFINNRYIKNPVLFKAVKEGYATALMAHDQPSFFIYLNIPSNEFDVNVHPRKLEVRFENSNHIYGLVKRAVQFSIEKSAQAQLQERLPQINNIKPPKTSAPILKSKSGAAQSFLDFKKPEPSINSSLEFTKNLLNETRIIANESDKKPIEAEVILTKNNKPSFMQIFNTYIVTVNEGSLLVIDQHAAHERVNFERLKISLEEKGSLQKQDLLIPEVIKINAAEAIVLRERNDLLQKIGFEYELSKDECKLRSIPLLISKSDPLTIFTQILGELQKSEPEDIASWRKISDKLISTMACHASIRAGRRMEQIEIENLLKDMFSCKLPYSCPHGRPIIWEISQKDIEKKMRRTL